MAWTLDRYDRKISVYMKLEDLRNAYESLSGRASEIIRQLSLAGIAIIWLFRSGTDTLPILDRELLRAALFIFLALFLDLLQYLSGTVIWFCYFRQKEKGGTEEAEDFLAPEWLNWPMWTLFGLKAIAMMIAYAWFIFPFLMSKFFT
jgi:hypothetical protein